MEPIAQLEARVRESSSDADVRLDLARALIEAGQPGEALLHLRLVEASPEARGEVRRLMGLAHLLSRDLPAAVEDLLAASRALPDDPVIREALDAALEGLLEPSAEERAKADAATEDLLALGIQPSATFDPFADPEDFDAAALEGLLGTLTDPCIGPPEPSAAAPLELTTLEAEDARPAEPAPVAEEGPLAEATPSVASGTDGASERGGPAAAAAAAPPSASSWDERQLDLNRLRRSLVVPSAAGQPSTVTVMRTARTGRKRRTAVWASLVALLGAVGFGAVTARQGGVIGGAKSALEPLPAIEGAASSSAGPSAPGREAGPLENPADPPSPADPPAPSSGATPDSSAAPTREAAVEEPTPAEDSPPASDGPGPRYAFLERLGLPAPPGGVIDAANSDARRLMDEAGERLSRPAVLTFRTEATVERVVRWYTERLPGVRFSARVVPMGGPFQGVQRTVARASTTLPSGYRIVVTVSRPGIDTASRRLVPETSVRVEIR